MLLSKTLVRQSVRAAVLLLSLTISALAVGDASAQLARMTLDDLANTSTSIVHGQATASRAVWNADGTQILTEVTVQIQDQLKGAGGSTTVITIPGGQIGNVIYEVSDMPSIDEGEEVLVFVWQHPSGRNLVTGGTQGKLLVERASALALPQVTGLFGLAGAAVDKRPTADAPAAVGLADLKTRIRKLVSNR
ncbi:MAG: hypothetical protein ACI80V_002370 [Rhodothermales bacterium]|jgi:hypothetical protein